MSRDSSMSIIAGEGYMTQLASGTILLERLERALQGWRGYGAVSTPQVIVELMIDLAEISDQQHREILEPACGFCNFLLSIYQRYPQNSFTGVELNGDIYSRIREAYAGLPFDLVHADYLLWEPGKSYDLIIGNPPYGIIGDGSHYAIDILKGRKEQYKRLFYTWFGKYNIYGAFIEKSVKLLRPTGKLVFITPATWMILDEFAKLRRFLALHGLTKVYYLGSGAFPGVSVSTAIIMFCKGGRGAELYCKDKGAFVRISNKPEWMGEILAFESVASRKVQQNKLLLGQVFDIKISARSPEVKCLSHLLTSGEGAALPLMNGRNLRKGFIERRNYTSWWLHPKDVLALKQFYGVVPRIVVGHTKGGKIVAAVENHVYPYVGDVYHLLPRRPLTIQQLEAIVDWLNSDEIDSYVRSLYKDISPHITATQLKIVPLPDNLELGAEGLFGR
jgi:adenine-specific DNA-methyltransferase